LLKGLNATGIALTSVCQIRRNFTARGENQSWLRLRTWQFTINIPMGLSSDGPRTELGTSPLKKVSLVSGRSVKDQISVEDVRGADIYEAGQPKKESRGS
jgi:hypothetical protein